MRRKPQTEGVYSSKTTRMQNLRELTPPVTSGDSPLWEGAKDTPILHKRPANGRPLFF